MGGVLKEGAGQWIIMDGIKVRTSLVASIHLPYRAAWAEAS